MKVTLALAYLIAVAAASPLLNTRQSATTCGSNHYTATQVSNAANRACTLVEEGETAGGSIYPETYNNFEGFDFPVNGPYKEFPILESGIYSGGSPGADRVVINTNCQFAGVITHTGASGNDFVGCTGTS